MTTGKPTAHYHRSQQQELATALVLVGGDSQDACAIHGSSRSAMVHPSAFVLNGLKLVVVATPGWCNGSLLSTRSDDDDDDGGMTLDPIKLSKFSSCNCIRTCKETSVCVYGHHERAPATSTNFTRGGKVLHVGVNTWHPLPLHPLRSWSDIQTNSGDKQQRNRQTDGHRHCLNPPLLQRRLNKWWWRLISMVLVSHALLHIHN